MQKTVMILGARAYQHQAIVKAKRLGYHVVATDFDKEAADFRGADVTEIVDYSDFDRLLEIAKENKIDGVTGIGSAIYVSAAYKISKVLGLPGLTDNGHRLDRDKFYLRQSMKKLGIPHPKYHLAHSLDEAMELSKNLDYPCVIKPFDGASSVGVKLIENESQLVEEFDKTLNNSLWISANKAVLMESFLDGLEYSLEVVSINNKVKVVDFLDKYNTPLPYFTEMDHSIPSLLEQNMKDEIIQQVTILLESIKIGTSPCAIEIKITKNGPRIIETNMRLPGGHMTELIELATGLDIIESIVKLAVGDAKPVDFEPKFHRAAVVTYFPSKNGILKSIVDKNDKIKGQLDIYKKIGDKITEVKNGYDRIASVMCDGDNLDDARSKVNEYMRNVIIEYENEYIKRIMSPLFYENFMKTFEPKSTEKLQKYFSVHFISKRQIINLGIDMAKAIELMKMHFNLHHNRKIILPPKTVLTPYNKDEKIVGRMNIMPSFIDIDGDYFYGVKVIPGKTDNIQLGIPRSNGILLLYNAHNSEPLLIADGTLISKLRTGAVTGLLCEYLAKLDSRVLCIIGTGSQASYQIWGCYESLPNLKQVRIYSPTEKHRNEFCTKIAEITQNTEIINCSSIDDALMNADVIVTCTNANESLVRKCHIKRGVLIISIGSFQEVEQDVVKASSMIVLDDFDSVIHRTSTLISRMHQDKSLPGGNIYDIGQLQNEAVSRKSDDDIIFCAPIGMGSEDAVIAWQIYKWIKDKKELKSLIYLNK